MQTDDSTETTNKLSSVKKANRLKHGKKKATSRTVTVEVNNILKKILLLKFLEVLDKFLAP